MSNANTLIKGSYHFEKIICLAQSFYTVCLTCENWPPQCSSHTVNRLVLFVSSGSRLLHSITIAWGIMMMHDTTQMTTMLLRALLAVLLNISGWQIAYQRSWAMQLSVKTDTETEVVWEKRKKHQLNMKLFMQLSTINK